MSKEFLIIEKSLLPKCFEKVVKAKELLNNNESITNICKKCGISRSTFYKYQDNVFPYKEGIHERKLVLSLDLFHKTGALSKVCDALSKVGISIITISQAVPLKGIAPVMVSLDISEMNMSLDDFKKYLKEISEIKELRIISYE